MSDMVAWLNACYDRAELRARAATEGPWRVAECGEIETVAAYGIPGYESPLHVTCDNSGGAPAVGENDAEYIADLDPSWRLADIGRKRKILAEHEIEWGLSEYAQSWGEGDGKPFGCTVCHQHDGIIKGDGYCKTLRLLAEEFDGEPGYDESWRP